MKPSVSGGPRAIPESACLLHIGAPKTATTAIQNASRFQRAELREAGVCYPGSGLNHARATSALLGDSGLKTSRAGHGAHLERVLQELSETAAPRRFLSNELMSGADEANASRIVHAFGPNVHVVVTLRSFCEMVPSIWQQYVKERKHIPFDEWLDRVFSVPPRDGITPSFWRRHDLGGLVERWSGVTSPDRVTVAMLDPADSRSVFRTFEDLLALPDGFFRERVSDGFASNRSLTSAEAELVRAVNAELADRDSSLEDYRDLIRFGLIGGIQRRRRPIVGERRTGMPEWAVERAVDVATRGVERVRELGVNVIGSLDRYAERPASVGLEPPPQEVELDLVAEAVAGVLSKAVGAGVGFEGARKRGLKPGTRVAPVEPRAAAPTSISVGDPKPAPLVLVAAPEEEASGLSHVWGDREPSRGSTESPVIIERTRDVLAHQIVECSTAPRPSRVDPDLLARIVESPRDRALVIVGPTVYDFDRSDVETIARVGGRPIEVVVFARSLAAAVSQAWEVALVTGTTAPYREWARRACRDRDLPHVGTVKRAKHQAEFLAALRTEGAIERATVIHPDAPWDDVHAILERFGPVDVAAPELLRAAEPRMDGSLAELLRSVNRKAAGRGIDLAVQARVLSGVVARLRNWPACETAVLLPARARWSTWRDARSAARVLARSGIREVGSGRVRRVRPARLFGPGRSGSTSETVSIAFAAAACAGAYGAAADARGATIVEETAASAPQSGDITGDLFPVRVLDRPWMRRRVRAARGSGGRRE